ncbi:MAG: hypothetical protein SchgKO_10420 [Schleiferiaceae bacterium]
MKQKLLILLMVGLVIGCSTTKTTTLISDDYNQEKNVTTLTILPHGHIVIPGKWTKTSYNEVSRQHFFVNEDSITIAVAKNPQDKYPFYQESMTDQEFVRKFYEWDSEYYEKQGFEIKENTIGDNYVVWTVSGKGAHTTFLFGGKDKYAYNIAVFTEQWTEEKRIEFLKSLFEGN